MNSKIMTGFFLVFVGLALSAFSVWKGGLPGEVYWNNGPVYISDQDERGSLDITPDQISSGKQEVKNLVVSTKEADVVVEQGTRFSILTDPVEKSSVTVSSNDGLVTVTAEEKNNWSFGIKNRNKHRIIITVPDKMTLDKLSLSNVNGSLKVKNQHGNVFSLTNVNGAVTVFDSKLEKSGLIDSRNGDVTIRKSTLPKLATVSRQGNVQIDKDYQNVHLNKADFIIRTINGDIALR
ncbi:DUF4097 family beta strand repeat-containing protein [Fructobacillus fructosus]|uniref:DUF4097 family beta strand repeat-containing protein n=1 Tax=Fructobacillus fructosus TaxID=1631 RepID=UPI002D8CB1AE|nr:Fusaric acid resistance protein-like (YvlB) [Fructobacillus fructosus]CAK1234323.1 Fusaric acid resistance protein-like (YvlB) [Fructobacillus fructosus]CAK1235918.1 Fusaric acid resistance protein-like (YvlB) [Fructobacillus fructosus]